MMEKGIKKNRAIILMYENTSEALNKIVEYIEQHDLDVSQILDIMRRAADELEAQSKVVQIVEDLRIGKI